MCLFKYLLNLNDFPQLHGLNTYYNDKITIITNSAIIMVETSGNRTTLRVPVAASHLPANIFL